MTDRDATLTVLVVDDEALLRWAIAEFLRQRGHTVLEAATAGEARWAMVSTSGAIDVVLLDYCLPDSSDLRLLEETRWRLPRCVVVLMTAWCTPQVLEDALAKGARCVLEKPFDMEDIGTVVARAQMTT